jgi:hypothetical protein
METEKILQQYKQNYCRIFESIYPSKNNTGFTERNLSVNFAKAYEQIYPQAFTWYEFQFGHNNNLHYDAIIINPENREIVVVESKRFSELFKKVREVGQDIERIRAFSTNYFEEFVGRIPNLKEYTVVGVILADVWAKGKNKITISEAFKNSSFIQYVRQHFCKIDEEESWFFNGQHFNIDFIDVKPSLVYPNDCIREQYHLVGLIWNVNKE